jgi:ABC-2 type transport system permease protein
MAGVLTQRGVTSALIRLKVATLRHAWRGSQSATLWSGATVGAAVSGWMVWTAFSAPSVGEGLDVLAVAFAFWALVWIMLPLVGGSGGDPLRPETFRLLAISPRRLAIGLLGAGAVGVMPAVSLVAFAGLVAVSLRINSAAAVIAVIAVGAMVALVVTLARVVVGALGRAAGTRLGLELAAIQYALLVAASFFWIPLIIVSTDAPPGGETSVLVGIAGAAWLLPTGWGVAAVAAAGRSDWAIVSTALGAQFLLIGVLAAGWVRLVAGRLELTGRTAGRSRGSAWAAVLRHRILAPASARGSVVARELRAWVRHPRRALELRVALWSAVLLAVVPGLFGSTVLWPWAGAIFVVIASNGLANVLGMDGTAYWMTLLVPDAERNEVRGRQLAWLAIVSAPGVLATIVLTMVSGHPEAWPAVVAVLPALLGAGAGLGILMAVATPAPLPERRGADPLDLGDDPTTGGNLVLHGVVMSLAVPALALPAVMAVSGDPIAGAGVGVASGVLYAWLGGALAIWRLQHAGPETLERLRSRPAARKAEGSIRGTATGRQPSNGRHSRWRSIARNMLGLVGALLVFPQGVAALVLRLSSADTKAWFVPLYLPEPWPIPAALGAIALGAGTWYVAWRIGRRSGAIRTRSQRGQVHRAGG